MRHFFGRKLPEVCDSVSADGYPSGGTSDALDDIRAAVLSWNSSRHMTIHGISLDGENKLLQSIAEATGGLFTTAK